MQENADQNNAEYGHILRSELFVRNGLFIYPKEKIHDVKHQMNIYIRIWKSINNNEIYIL